jgi:hypothetical protein
MTSEDGEEITQALFASLGLPLQRVVRSEVEPRPDFEAVDVEGQLYLVETKTRFDTDKFREALEGDGLGVSEPRLDHDNTAEAILKSAVKQLSAMRSDRSDLAILCYVFAGFSTDMQSEQLRSTLWGTVRVVDVFDLAFSTPCFYLGPSAFLRYPNLDGVLAIEPATGRVGLYPNRFSPRRVEDSMLGRSLAELRAVFTPEDAQAHGAGVVLPISVDAPGDFRSRLRAVQVMTGRRGLSPMRSMGFQSAFRVPADGLP